MSSQLTDEMTTGDGTGPVDGGTIGGPTGTPAVSMVGLRKAYAGRRKNAVEALKGIDIDVRDGEMLVLLGPSGCGKSTMLRCVAGLERPTAGRIDLHGTTLTDASRNLFAPPNKRDIGLVFQTYVLWPHMTVRKNVEYPLRARGLKDRIGQGRVDEVLDLVHCRHLADRYPAQLSGGQQQRIALARALVSDPQVLLLDEPLSNLDALLRVTLRAQLREIHRTVGYTGIYVTHDQSEALSLGDRVAVMEEGLVAQVATPRELFESPSSEYVANFLGIRNRIPIRTSGGVPAPPGGFALSGMPGADPGGAALADGDVQLYFRPESVRLEPAGSGGDIPGLSGDGVVREALYGGTTSEYVAQVGDHEVFARTSVNLSHGDRVKVSVPSEDLLLYTSAGELARPNM